MSASRRIEHEALRQDLSYLILGKRGGGKKVRILELLKERPYNINQLAKELDVNYRTAMHHVNVLEEHKLISRSRPPLGKGHVFNLKLRSDDEQEILSEIMSKFKLSEKVLDFSYSPEFFQRVVEQTNDAVVIIDDRKQLFFLNESAERLFGLERKEGIGNPIKMFPEGLDEFLDISKSGGIVRDLETRARHRSGTSVDVTVTMDPIKDNEDKIVGYSMIVRDITERKQLERERVRTERLRMIGKLAGGVGQELHNPLASIKNAIYFLRIALESSDPEVEEVLDILEAETSTSEHIIRELLDLAWPSTRNLMEVDIKETLEKALSESEVPDNIEVRFRPEGGPNVVISHPEKLFIVFFNIISNALEAMPHGGTLTILSRCTDSDSVSIEFKDTGKGIPDEMIGKVFDPLFTTKAKGIGLGLYLSKSIIEGQGGIIKVQNNRKDGCDLTITLPTVFQGVGIDG
ncbi:MAG: PAS domain S-box protein [Thermoplasmatota archaeon]